ncbi:M28 family peptidase [Pleomorphovibrio marinus]|uniref:M28 family peptidase n=1 Tax=Pleomorphovibrio marinus TaxID=2164132 RepID=UPI000E0C26E1|nr:M28 family peptidase [Pleomorphovibrio marinus]
MNKTPIFLLLFLFQQTLAQTLHEGFQRDQLKTQVVTETAFLEKVDFSSFRRHLEQISSEPHVVGSSANEKVASYLKKTMEEAGWEVKYYPYDVYLPKEPGESYVEIISPKRKPLNQQEYVVPEDPYSNHPKLHRGWNAYSGSGDVSGEIVYANYGTKKDFEKLRELGVSLTDKIVIARYGGNFRGYKAKFAEEYGAAGLLIYTDPADAGFMKGLVYPEGIYYDESSIQRGSLMTENFTGDPLTPFEPALPLDGEVQVKRLKPSETQLPTIPVTPIPYGAAKEIFEEMKGEAVPSEWQGGLPFTYRVEGGSDLQVKLTVKQERDFVRINNVVGFLEGAEYPDEWVILGCHYDAWSFGATDPNSGTAMLLTLGEALGELAESGYKPKRSLLIAHWDGEEHGVIGSTEWVEQLLDELQAKAVAYLNFDAGVSGKNIGGAASPSLKKILVESSKAVQFPDTTLSFHDVWVSGKEEPNIRNLGGGSDHIAFYMHAGIPALSAGSGGPTLYHTNYDNLHFYEKFVDPDFQMGGAVAQWAGIMALRLANADIIPYRITRYARDLKTHMENASSQAKSLNSDFAGFEKSLSAIKDLQKDAQDLTDILSDSRESNNLNLSQINRINKSFLQLEKNFLLEDGMPFGSWYRSLYASSDPFSGYASWVLPGIQFEIEQKKVDKFEEWDAIYAQAIERLSSEIRSIKSLLE